ncbi:hypothetical protein [Rubripirellula tenax]|uniref:hypothetical protein n=1 Tax=Rubripirellula tenax TaxID=2528015 RepID=UPI001FEC140E|nr:hypothetical protein [Rubripirellula tenax]
MNASRLDSSGNEMVLRDDHIIETVATLQRRIEDRFPNAGLASLCMRLHQVACKAAEKSASIAQPIRWIRVFVYLIAAALLGSLVAAIYFAIQFVNIDPAAIAEEISAEPVGVVFWIQALESILNDIIFLAIAIFFLFSLENRIKRRRALAALHELRSIAHVIDMHQLTKDPERFFRKNSDTKHSPKQTMTPFLLNRYLDYCSEMLSLTGKIAALYVQHFDDADAVAAVSEIEQLTNGMSRKIWQKIMVLEQSREALDRIDAEHATAASKTHTAPVTPAMPPTSDPSDSSVRQVPRRSKGDAS